MRLLLAAAMLMASTSYGQILRPPAAECTPSQILYCEIFQIDPCPCGTIEFVRVRPFGPPRDPWAGSYMLPKTIGVMQTAYEPEPVQPPRTAHMTSYELLNEVAPYGFGAIKIWMDAIPFDGMGEWCWQTDWGQEICANYNTDGLEMERFWQSIPDGMAVFLRPTSPAWTWYEVNPCIESSGAGPQMAMADYYAISMRLYDIIGDHNIQIIFTDWEQDWISCHGTNGGLSFLLTTLDKRQSDVERARRDEWLRLGHRPKLEIYHAVVVNKYPLNAPDWEYPYLTTLISTLKHRPDFIGLSYWLREYDPIETLDWIRDTTGYPPYRIYIDELGANENKQVQRFTDYIPVLWDWGIRTINIWMWKQTWCAVPVHANKGLWEQQQPCLGRVIFTEPTAGLAVLEGILNE